MSNDAVTDDLMRVSNYTGLNPSDFRENRGLCARIYGEAKGWCEANGYKSERTLWNRIHENIRIMMR